MTELEPLLHLIKDWIWIPLVTVVTSAVGMHLKVQRDCRKDLYEKIKETNDLIQKEHRHVEENYVRQGTFEIIREDIGEVKEELKRLGRDIRSGGN